MRAFFSKKSKKPNLEEITHFFEEAFLSVDEQGHLLEDQDQSLAEWFSVHEMMNHHGQLIEKRANGKLVGALFIGKEHTLTWEDGKKMEVFILGVHRNFRGMGIAKELMQMAEEFARDQRARKIIVNTHVDLKGVHLFYEKLGYEKIGILSEYYDNGDAVFFQKKLTEFS